MNLTESRKKSNPGLSDKTQRYEYSSEALEEYILIVLFVSLLNRVHFLAFSMFIWTEKHGSERVN